MSKIGSMAVLVLAMFFPANSLGQKGHPIQWAIKPGPAATAPKAGETIEVRLVATIADGWHLYAQSQPEGSPVIPTHISIQGGPLFKLAGEIKSPFPTVTLDPNFGVETEYYEGTATFVISVAIAPSAPPGKQKLQVSAFYQTCTESTCLPPRTDKVELTIEIR